MKGKTFLKRKVKNTDEPPKEYDVTSSRIIKGKTSLAKKKNSAVKETALPEKNITESLIEQIVLAYFTSKWQKKVIEMNRRVASRPNKKLKDVRTLFNLLNRAFDYHTYLYLKELIHNMKNMPVPSGVKHDPNYGKIFLVKGEEKAKNYEEKIVINEVIIEDRTHLREKNDRKPRKKINDYEDELAEYYYRNDGKPLDRVEIEEEINRLIKENPEKDIDVERILNSKRLQYKLKHPRFSPFTKKENLDSFVKYLYTYKPEKNKEKNENIILIKNKTYAYY